jgi:hydroxyacyl-ACP dehydratase HTD2-like protein with hotdog domain
MSATTTAVRFEQLAVGDQMPCFTRGPLGTVHLFRWSAAIENLHRIHYDLPFATEHDGLPALPINGSWKQHFLVQAIRRWIEPEGWLAAISFQFRAVDPVNSTLTAWGTVADLAERAGYGWVTLEIGIRNQDGRESTPGRAECVLPVAGGAPVPYPFPETLR